MDSPSEKPKILVADDADIGRSILRALLRGDFDVVEARNGLEAVKALTTSGGHFAAVILDVMMPVMDGYGVLRFMRENELLGRVPAVMLTAISDTEAKNRCYEAGATDVVEKPYDEKLLLCRIRALVACFSAVSSGGADSGAEDREVFAEDVLDALPDAVYAAESATKRITYANAAFRALPGLSGDPVGRTLAECLPAAAEAAAAVVDDLLVRRVRSERPFRLPGDPRQWWLSCNALLDESGSISDIVGHVSDRPAPPAAS